MEQETTVSHKNRRRPKKLTVILGLLLVLVLLAAVVFFVKYRQAVNNNPTTQRDHLLKEIGQDIALPKETPTISTVLDASKITNPTLAAQAQNGDKLLVYANAKRLIVYRPSSRKVVDILSIQAPAPVPAAAAPQTSKTTTNSKY